MNFFYFECIGSGKGKNSSKSGSVEDAIRTDGHVLYLSSGPTSLRCKGKISGYVHSLTPHKKWRPCSCWSRRSSAWRTRVTLCLTLEPLHRLHLPHSGLALHNSHASLPPHLHARTPLCLRKGSSPFLALCFRKGSSPFLAWPLHNDTIKQTCSSACFSMAAASRPLSVSRSPLFKRALQSL